MQINPTSLFSTSFGEHLLALRFRTGLSQTQLALAAGVKRQSLARWEQGEAFPQSPTLQRLIGALTQHHAFTSGREIDEATALWEHANNEGPRRFPIFDAAWFDTMLARMPQKTATSPPLFDWGEASVSPLFYGRDSDLGQLQHWLMNEGCRVIGVFGSGGIGKSSLAVAFAHQVVTQFEVIIFRSLRDAAPLHETLQSMLRLFGQPGSRDTHIGSQLEALLTLLRERRCLIILDNLETIMQTGERLGEYRSGYSGYGELIRLIAESTHRSCLLLTSRERPRQFWLLEQQSAPVHSLVLQGLSPQACQVLLAPAGLRGEPEDWRVLAQHYSGNPLTMKLIAETIRDSFERDIAAFLRHSDAIPHEMGDVLAAQLERISEAEYALLLWLAIEREPANAQQLADDVVGAIDDGHVFQALETLLQRTMIERVKDQDTFSLQPVVQEFLTERFVEQVASQVQQGQLDLICQYALLQGTAKEYVRQSQSRLIVEPCLARLRAHYGSSEAVVSALMACLDALRGVPLPQQRYGGSNLAHLLARERGDLRSVNLSGLTLLQPNFAGVAMQGADLRGAHVRQAIFTGQLSSTYNIAISPDGAYLAATTLHGFVYIWRTSDFVQIARFQAHDHWICQIRFCPDGTALATASRDGSIGIWSVPEGQLLERLVEPCAKIWSVAWAGDGMALFSCNEDGQIHRWSLASATITNTIEPSEPAATTTIAVSPDGRSIACGYGNGMIGVWDAETLALRLMFKGHAGHIWTLAWHPDSRRLATGSADSYIRVWDTEQHELRDMFQASSAVIFGVAWSADGRLLASSSGDGLVRIWESESSRCLLTLEGHTAGAFGVAFYPDGSAVASSGEDQTVRVWDVATGQRRATLAGWSQVVQTLAWHPNGNTLASGSSDGRVTVWDSARGERIEALPLRANWSQSLCYSPDGTRLVAGGRDGVIRTWHTGTHELLQLRGHADQVAAITISPEGQRLASASYDGRIAVWSIRDGMELRAMGRTNQMMFAVAWHPNEEIIASGGMDERVTLWDVSRGEPRATLQAHNRFVRTVAWNSDGSMLASSDFNGVIIVWDWRQQAARVRFAGHAKDVWVVAFHPYQPVLASGSEDGTVRLWDVTHGILLAVLDGGVGAVRALAWSPDGRMLASGGAAGWIILWDVEHRREHQRFRNERPYERMRIAGIHGITPAQHAILLALGADDTE